VEENNHQHYPQPYEPYPKLGFKYFGPYRVLECIGPAAYKLDLSEDSRVHHVFPISQLKSFIPDHTPVYADISKLVNLSAVDVVPEAILDRRLVKRSNTARFSKTDAL
jgi:hypothetical protein